MQNWNYESMNLFVNRREITFPEHLKHMWSKKCQTYTTSCFYCCIMNIFGFHTWLKHIKCSGNLWRTFYPIFWQLSTLNWMTLYEQQRCVLLWFTQQEQTHGNVLGKQQVRSESIFLSTTRLWMLIIKSVFFNLACSFRPIAFKICYWSEYVFMLDWHRQIRPQKLRYMSFTISTFQCWVFRRDQPVRI